jgi:hypothetical protein
VIDMTLRCPECGQRADMCFEHGDGWKKRPDDPTVAQLLVKATTAELEARVYAFCDEDGYELPCTHCNGDGECDANANPLWDCDDSPHDCHACGGTGNRRDQRIF